MAVLGIAGNFDWWRPPNRKVLNFYMEKKKIVFKHKIEADCGEWATALPMAVVSVP